MVKKTSKNWGISPPEEMSSFEICLMSKFKDILVPEDCFHIFNRAVGNDKLFIKADNYFYFLHLFQKYISPVSDVFSYSLLPNHFHFFLRFKNPVDIFKQVELLDYPYASLAFQPRFLLQQFSNFFNAYTKTFNYSFERKGKLFIEPFSRRTVNTPGYYTKLVYNVHANPVHHGFCNKVGEWPYSSYSSFINNGSGFIKTDEVIQWFGSLKEFIQYHEQPVIIRSNRTQFKAIQ